VQLCVGNGTCTPKEILSEINPKPSDTCFLHSSCNIKLISSSATTNATYAACEIPSHDIGPVIVGIPATFGSLAIIFVLLRIYARVVINKFFAWDDRFIILALVYTLFPPSSSLKGFADICEIGLCFAIELPSFSEYVLLLKEDIQAEMVGLMCFRSG
jgi:hypothetical protein